MMPSYRALATAGVNIPPKHSMKSDFSNACLDFIRHSCLDLKFTGAPTPPFGPSHDFNRDIDRLCLENAAARFLMSGSRDDAFDVYVSYCEIFRPFGDGYDSTRCLVELLAEHEENSSSLLMKHRDHYSHSVYVYFIGLCLYQNNPTIREAYNQCYGLAEGAAACCHFLEYWGFASLFHDVGYPFEIAHQQMKVYACTLSGILQEDMDNTEVYSPFVSYRRMPDFTTVELDGRPQDLNTIFAQAICARIGDKYGVEAQALEALLRDRPVNQEEKDGSYRFLDHAYFSGLILAKKYLQGHPSATQFPQPVLDGMVAVILHNSLFKFSIRGKQPPLTIQDGQPLAYLLMLCDELQCWNRTSYGQNSRNAIFPYEFDLKVSPEDGSILAVYHFDERYVAESHRSKSYHSLTYHSGQCKFVSDIQKIVDVSQPGLSLSAEAEFTLKKRKTKSYASKTSYLNIYDFALALNGRYDSSIDMSAKSSNQEILAQQNQLVASFEKLSLEFKLSNIAQAKGFASHLESINCFYTNGETDYTMVQEFTPLELLALAKLEHQRWQDEKESMGWVYGTDYANGAERALKRHHKDMVPFEQLSHEDILKDSEPMSMMIRLLKLFDGLNIYRMD